MRSSRRLAALIAVVFAAALFAACGEDDPAEGSDLAGIVRAPALQVGGIELSDVSDGGDEPVAMRAPAGELYLVYFGYTSCPDICPTTMSDISVAVNDLSADLAPRVTVGMVTVDPERDTAELLDGYLGHFFDRKMALRTEDPEVLAAAAEAFGVRFEVEAHESGTSYGVSHSAVTYVVDDAGTVVVEWPFGFDSRDMTADLTTLLTKEST
jgi:protein SCO1/2